tara:strand:+ start:247 stop:729 length:483 start_codon:yes stop_codon:yes gene_type:complete
MIIEFSSLPETARIWIYQCNRSFSTDEIQEISNKLYAFLEGWTAHGNDLKAAFEIRYKRFIIIGLNQDQQLATGCSIDASVHFIQQLETAYKVNLLDKLNVSYKQGDYIAYKTLKEFKKMIKDKAVSKNTIVFNHLVQTKAEYADFWEVPAANSWHNRFF